MIVPRQFTDGAELRKALLAEVHRPPEFCGFYDWWWMSLSEYQQEQARKLSPTLWIRDLITHTLNDEELIFQWALCWMQGGGEGKP
jgi:hypothetical protein